MGRPAVRASPPPHLSSHPAGPRLEISTELRPPNGVDLALSAQAVTLLEPASTVSTAATPVCSSAGQYPALCHGAFMSWTCRRSPAGYVADFEPGNILEPHGVLSLAVKLRGKVRGFGRSDGFLASEDTEKRRESSIHSQPVF